MNPYLITAAYHRAIVKCPNVIQLSIFDARNPHAKRLDIAGPCEECDQRARYKRIDGALVCARHLLGARSGRFERLANKNRRKA